jgi:hypothetical protein
MVNFSPSCQIFINPPNPFPVSILPGTTWKSGVMSLQQPNAFIGALTGYNAILAGLLSSQIVTITIQRYIDPNGLYPVGAAGTQATTAAMFGSANVTAFLPAMFFDVQIVNAGMSQAVITPGSFAIVIAPNA